MCNRQQLRPSNNTEHIFFPAKKQQQHRQQADRSPASERIFAPISPPFGFRSDEPKTQLTGDSRGRAGLKVSKSMPKLHSTPAPAAKVEDTQLVTRLTRRKFKPDANEDPHEQKRNRLRSQTKLEQHLVAPKLPPADDDKDDHRGNATFAGQRPSNVMPNNCRFKAQVMFESDTDSAADRQSVASSRIGSQLAGATARQRLENVAADPSAKLSDPKRSQLKKKKELITETKYSSYLLNNNSRQPAGELGSEPAKPAEHKLNSILKSIDVNKQVENGSVSLSARNNRKLLMNQQLMPNWDYSLRVNRMCGDKIDRKVK